MFQVDRYSCHQQENECISDNNFPENFEVLQKVLFIDREGIV